MVNANISTSNDDAQFDEDLSEWERMWMNPPEPGSDDIAEAALEAFYAKLDAQTKAQYAF